MNRPAITAWIMFSSGGMPLPGNHWSLYQKMYNPSSPSQKTGAETPMRAKIIPARSKMDRGLIAETIPMGRPIASQTTAAPSAKVAVTGTRE
jgi:hypothetical protein